MDPVSITLSAIALCPMIIATGKELRKVARSVKYARSEIDKLSNELIIFAGELDDFSEAFQHNHNESSIKVPIQALFTFSFKAYKDAKGLLKRVKALAADPDQDFSFTEVIDAYVKWFFSKTAVNCIRAMLSVARESINGLTNIYHIQQMDEELQMLRAILTRHERREIEQRLGMTIEERKDMLKKKICNRRIVRHEITKRMKAANDKVIQFEENSKDESFKPKAGKSIKLTEAVEGYAETLLPINQSGRRSRILRPIDLSSTRTSSSSQPSQHMNSTVVSSPTSTTSVSMTDATTDSSSVELYTVERTVMPGTSSPTSSSDTDILKYCSICQGTCLCTDEHHMSESTDNAETSHGLVEECLDNDGIDASDAEKGTTKVPIVNKFIPEIVLEPEFSVQFIPAAKSEAESNCEDITSRMMKVMEAPETSRIMKVSEVPDKSSPDHEKLEVRVEEDHIDDNETVNDESVADDDVEEEWREGQSPYRPLFGISGTRPRGLRARHERKNSC